MLADVERAHILRILGVSAWRIEGAPRGRTRARPEAEYPAEPHAQAWSQTVAGPAQGLASRCRWPDDIRWRAAARITIAWCPMDSESRVFVVDDDRALLTAIERVLSSSGHRVQTFTSPAFFMEQLPYDGPACLVLDLRMPELSGLDVQEWLAFKGITIPTVFLSGESDVRSTARAMRKGAVDFLVKPVDENDLLVAVSRALATAVESRRRRREEEQCSAASRPTDPPGASGVRAVAQRALEQADRVRARHE